MDGAQRRSYHPYGIADLRLKELSIHNNRHPGLEIHNESVCINGDLLHWIGYTKLYRKYEVMVYFEGKERRRKPWLKDENEGPTARSRRSNWLSCTTTASPEVRSSGSTT